MSISCIYKAGSINKQVWEHYAFMAPGYDDAVDTVISMNACHFPLAFLHQALVVFACLCPKANSTLSKSSPSNRFETNYEAKQNHCHCLWRGKANSMWLRANSLSELWRLRRR
jgi:hypothetical protein